VRATAQLLIAYDVTSLADAASLDSRECLHRMEQQSAEFVGLVEQVSAAWSVQLPRVVPCEYAYLDPSARGGEFAERLIADSLRSTTHFRTPDNLDAALAAALSTAAGSSVTRSLGTVARADVAPPVRRAVPASASASSSTAAAAKPAMFAPKRQHPSLASVAVAARATAAPKHKVVIMSTKEWNELDGAKGARRGVAAADVDERKKQLASEKQAEREQKMAARAEAKLKREAERAAKKQQRADGAERAPRPKKAKKATNAPSDGALSAVDGMGQLITAVGEKSDDDDDFDSDDDDVDDDESVSQETEVARRMQKTLRQIESSSAAPPVHSISQSSFMLGTSAPLFPAKSASVAPPPPTSGAPQWSATSEPDYSKMLSAVMPHVTSLPLASAAAALASLMPMSAAAATAAPPPPPPPPVVEPDRNSVEAMLRNVFEGADPSLVSAAHEEKVRRFLSGQADNYDPANPIQALLIRRVVIDDVEVSLVIELNYATKTWRKLNRRKRLGPQI
jgi:hypothetical protein